MDKKPPRVWGPKPHGRGYRLYFRVDGKTRATPTVPTKEAAEKLKRALIKELEAQDELSLQGAFTQYEAHLHGKGNKAQSVRGTLLRLREFFKGHAGSLRSLSRSDCAACYSRLVKEPRAATGRPMAPDSHRNYLAEAKSFLRWCVGQGFLKENPLSPVQGQGRRRRGKAQLGIDESRKLSAVAFDRARAGDTGAVAVLVCLHLRLRASELTHLRVRDLDDGGRLLWVRRHHDREESQLKTPAAERGLNIPAFLQPLLLELAAGRRGIDLLFGKHWRDWPREQTERLCKLAAVPRVTAHGLRGLGSTLALVSGEDPEVVARSLGHTNSKITLDVYAAPGTREHLESERLGKALNPDRLNPADLAGALPRPIPGCKHLGTDGCCNHPDAATPECHLSADCPPLDSVGLTADKRLAMYRPSAGPKPNKPSF